MKLVEQVIDIDAPPADVYDHSTDPERFTRWMAPTATFDPRRDGTIRWTHANGDSCEGAFIDLVPSRRIVFTYGWDRPDVDIPPGSTTVEITLEPIGTGTRLRLTHRGLTEPMADAHRRGWTNHLARLPRAASGR